MKSVSKVKSVEKKRGKRETKAYETRQALLSAAAKTVGKFGYERASIAKITTLAGVANGTFYNYFETRQELFEQLLPAVGERLLDQIRRGVDKESFGVNRERQRMAASLEFFRENPGFLRVLNEAEVYAPRAFRLHVKKFATAFEKGLKVQLKNGEMGTFDEDELKTVVYILMGARSYLMMQAGYSKTKFTEDMAESYLSTYTKLLECGLFISDKRNAN